MAKQVQRKARKDYPDIGIKKGDTYYYVDLKTGPRSKVIMRSLTPFKPSQLTASEFKQGWYEAKELLEALKPLDADTVREVAQELETLGEETQERFDNMPEGLQGAPTGEQMQARIDACETAAQELGDIADRFDELPDPDDQEEPDYGDTVEDLTEEAVNVLDENEPD